MENEFQIRILLVKEIFGTITAEEQEKLDKILATSEEARALRIEVKNNTITAGRKEFYTRDMEADFQEVLRRHHLIKMRRLRNRLLAGAMIAGVLAAAYWAWPRLPEAVSPRPVMPARSHAVVLEFANGETVAMQDKGLQSYRIGGTSVYKDSRFLRFAPAAADAAGWNTLSVPPRKEQRLLLGDGTEVYLNSATKLRFPFSFPEGKREVYLDGEAYFIVRNDPARPFIVHAGQADIQVNGSEEFNVDAYTATRVTTSLISGQLTVAAAGREARLMPMEQALVATHQPIMKKKYDPAYTTQWVNGEVYFDNMTIRDLGNLTSRWFNTTLHIDSREAGEKLVTGKTFRNQPLDDLIDQINELKTAELYWKNGMLHAK
ncbi:FecR family protein [Chitinophaga sp. GCM10012297]|uniref:FecR domain-containing protein n=1 Tax=Chitinophaga chungangae TaxID=2821488 RepID=A0ABS3YC68_9BACT|nr:FecR domain-containing protein [Chitinophaga chungangae]MBO9152261.1 FecR domain-containing protein [Chitinophaga chungangae]